MCAGFAGVVVLATLTAIVTGCAVCCHTMKRTTVKVPDELDREMRDEAARRGITVSQWTREAIAAHLPRQGGRRRLLAVAAGASGRSDISERIEEILRDELPTRG